MDLQLKNKMAPVTGSTAGIGFPVASPPAEEGAGGVVRSVVRIRPPPGRTDLAERSPSPSERRAEMFQTNAGLPEAPRANDAARDREALAENFAAELTSAIYPVALREGMKGSWLDVELGLWKALAVTVKEWETRGMIRYSACDK
jgi:hypothetical protein